MKTTIDLNDALATEAEAVAAKSGRSLTALIEDALRERLARLAAAPELPPARSTTLPERDPQGWSPLEEPPTLAELLR
jgi:hypothetical protein